MKKLLFFTIFLFTLSGYAQFGVKISYVAFDLKSKGENLNESEIIDGLGLGLDYGFNLGKFKLIAGINADFVSEDGEESESVITPSLGVKYYIGNKIGLRGGLAVPIWDIPRGQGLLPSALHVPFGLDYAISDKISIFAMYSIAAQNRLDIDYYENTFPIGSWGIDSITDSSFNFGIHYSF